ncbi:threonine aldolase family protein [Roseovarius albus]|nr:beta-eliminating lyase-related protein [Roseovarius albus]
MANYQFNSDNGAPICPAVMDALISCNTGVETAYGADHYTERLNAVYTDIFEREAFVFPVPTGTAGNGLALGALTPSYGTIFCHRQAHLVTTECGAPEFYSGGCRLTLLGGEHNKVTPGALEQSISAHGVGNVHHMAASTLSFAQATEAGVTYSPEEIAALTKIARQAGMKTHMDGARFANALVYLGVSPAEMSWKCGVDILTFGTTKNGTMNAEAVITFDTNIARTLRFMHKRAGHLFSKMRYMSAQLLSYVENDLWLINAKAANSNTSRIAKALGRCEGVRIVHPVHINELFVAMPDTLQAELQAVGITLRPWQVDANTQGYRIVTTFCDDPDLIGQLEQVCELHKRTTGNDRLDSLSLR